MKKDLIFAPVLLLIAAVLWLLKFTGMEAHIAVSILGVVCLIAYTVQTKKEWKIPALEIIMRACYGIALITGVIIMNVAGVGALAYVHKISATLFALLLIVLFVIKLRSKKA